LVECVVTVVTYGTVHYRCLISSTKRCTFYIVVVAFGNVYLWTVGLVECVVVVNTFGTVYLQNYHHVGTTKYPTSHITKWSQNGTMRYNAIGLRIMVS